MGKTAAGAVWLNADMLPVYDYWQFWRNTEDGDVERFLKLFTTLPLDEIARLAALQGPGDQRGEEGARHRGDRAAAWPRGGRAGRRHRAHDLRGRRARREPADGRNRRAPNWTTGLGVLSAFAEKTGLVASNGEARRQIKGGGLKVNDATVTDEKMTLSLKDADARRRDQALARPQEARADQAGVSLDLSRRRQDTAAPRCGRSRAPRNSKILRKMPGASIDIGMTRRVALPGGPATS